MRTKAEILKEIKSLDTDNQYFDPSPIISNGNDFRTEDGESWSDIPELNGDEIVEEIN